MVSRSNYSEGIVFALWGGVRLILCLLASWVVVRFWNVYALLAAVVLYVICGIAIFHLRI
jgi:hypothetical protein